MRKTDHGSWLIARGINYGDVKPHTKYRITEGIHYV
jgi:hypothetical protein